MAQRHTIEYIGIYEEEEVSRTFSYAAGAAAGRERGKWPRVPDTLPVK